VAEGEAGAIMAAKVSDFMALNQREADPHQVWQRCSQGSRRIEAVEGAIDQNEDWE
jgi:hypothetical protein